MYKSDWESNFDEIFSNTSFIYTWIRTKDFSIKDTLFLPYLTITLETFVLKYKKYDS